MFKETKMLITTKDPLEGIDIYPAKYIIPISENPLIIVVPIKSNSRCYSNIKKSKEFVINFLGEEYNEIFEKAASEYPRGFNELEIFGLTEEKSEKVSVPRIKEAKNFLECEWIGAVEIDSIHLLENIPVFARVLYAK